MMREKRFRGSGNLHSNCRNNNNHHNHHNHHRFHHHDVLLNNAFSNGNNHVVDTSSSSTSSSSTDDDSELEYGPGIVAKLKTKFLRYSMKSNHNDSHPSPPIKSLYIFEEDQRATSTESNEVPCLVTTAGDGATATLDRVSGSTGDGVKEDRPDVHVSQTVTDTVETRETTDGSKEFEEVRLDKPASPVNETCADISESNKPLVTTFIPKTIETAIAATAVPQTESETGACSRSSSSKECLEQHQQQQESAGTTTHSVDSNTVSATTNSSSSSVPKRTLIRGSSLPPVKPVIAQKPKSLRDRVNKLRQRNSETEAGATPASTSTSHSSLSSRPPLVPSSASLHSPSTRHPLPTTSPPGEHLCEGCSTDPCVCSDRQRRQQQQQQQKEGNDKDIVVDIDKTTADTPTPADTAVGETTDLSSSSSSPSMGPTRDALHACVSPAQRASVTPVAPAPAPVAVTPAVVSQDKGVSDNDTTTSPPPVSNININNNNNNRRITAPSPLPRKSVTSNNSLLNGSNTSSKAMNNKNDVSQRYLQNNEIKSNDNSDEASPKCLVRDERSESPTTKALLDLHQQKPTNLIISSNIINNNNANSLNMNSKNINMSNKSNSSCMIFDFRGKNVKPQVAITSPFGRSAVIDAEDLDDESCDKESSSCDSSSSSLSPVLCFLGENEIIGKGSLLKIRNKKLRIHFDDSSLSSTYEYPSEAYLYQHYYDDAEEVENTADSSDKVIKNPPNGVSQSETNSSDNSPTGTDSQSNPLINNSDSGHILVGTGLQSTLTPIRPSGGLASYKPAFLSQTEASIFELGVSSRSSSAAASLSTKMTNMTSKKTAGSSNNPVIRGSSSRQMMQQQQQHQVNNKISNRISSIEALNQSQQLQQQRQLLLRNSCNSERLVPSAGNHVVSSHENHFLLLHQQQQQQQQIRHYEHINTVKKYCDVDRVMRGRHEEGEEGERREERREGGGGGGGGGEEEEEEGDDFVVDPLIKPANQADSSSWSTSSTASDLLF